MFDFYGMQMLFSSVVYQLLAELAPRAQPWPGVSCEYTAKRLALQARGDCGDCLDNIYMFSDRFRPPESRSCIGCQTTNQIRVPLVRG